ncbi:MAG: hypothetical protein N0E48_26160, partial [Candidatus Thiodiazotropha endolucinida]|nr:hypothetical protein [Candidatus Thiodiazotropha taylori]MCW4346811.1 hypothetical protein [Candidatus Thiodiazotropha endolucinida]
VSTPYSSGNSSTPNCAGKKKATSPLDGDQTLKKHRECPSVDSVAHDSNIDRLDQEQCHDRVGSPVMDEQISNV